MTTALTLCSYNQNVFVNVEMIHCCLIVIAVFKYAFQYAILVASTHSPVPGTCTTRGESALSPTVLGFLHICDTKQRRRRRQP